MRGSGFRRSQILAPLSFAVGSVLLSCRRPVGGVDLLSDALGYALLLAAAFSGSGGGPRRDRGVEAARWVILLTAPFAGLWVSGSRLRWGFPTAFFGPLFLWTLCHWGLARVARDRLHGRNEAWVGRLLFHFERLFRGLALGVAVVTVAGFVLTRLVDEGPLMMYGLQNLPPWLRWLFCRAPFLGLRLALGLAATVGLWRAAPRGGEAGTAAPADPIAPARIRVVPLLVVLALASAMNGWGLWWLLPSHSECYADPLVRTPMRAVTGDVGPHYNRDVYPPMQHHLVKVAMAVAGDALDALGFSGSTWQRAGWLMGSARAVSAVMGVLMLAFVYVLACRVTGRWEAAAPAAFIVAVNPMIVLRAHMTNPDMGYLLWLAISLWLADRIRVRDRASDWVWLGLCAALSFTTKEQSGAALVGVALVVLWFGWGHARAEHARSAAFARVGRRAATALACFAFTFICVHEILSDTAPFIRHVQALTGFLGRPRIENDLHLRGIGDLMLLSGKMARRLVSLPLAAVVVIGVAAAIRHRARNRLPWLGVPLLTYYASLAAVPRPRHFLPVLVILACFAGFGAYRLWRAHRWRFAVRALLGLLAAFLLWRGIVVDIYLHRNSRLDARRWMEANLDGGPVISYLGAWVWLPQVPAGCAADRTPDVRSLVAWAGHEYLVASSAHYEAGQHFAPLIAADPAPDGDPRRRTWRVVTDHRLARFYCDLLNGKLPYEMIACFRRRLPLDGDTPYQLNPEVMIFRRTTPRQAEITFLMDHPANRVRYGSEPEGTVPAEDSEVGKGPLRATVN